MLPDAVIEEVRQLLDEGELSQRMIALKVKVSRGTVAAISKGRRGIDDRNVADGRPSTLCRLNVLPERCTSCGGWVYKPCVLCRARKFKAKTMLITSLRRETKLPARYVA